MSKSISVQCTACKRQRFLPPRDAANVRTFCPECGNLERYPIPKTILDEPTNPPEQDK